jgi:two-component system, response regulator, stage 0 sporulation protein F
MSLSLPSISQPRSNATILVVDDSPSMLRRLRLVLESDSYQVETAGSAAEAMLCMQRGCIPAVVVLDVRTPGMGGLETLRSLLNLQPGLKVIMFSGVDDPGQIRRAVSLGAQVCLTKPVPHLYLSAAVTRCLGGEVSLASAAVAGTK